MVTYELHNIYRRDIKQVKREYIWYNLIHQHLPNRKLSYKYWQKTVMIIITNVDRLFPEIVLIWFIIEQLKHVLTLSLWTSYHLFLIKIMLFLFILIHNFMRAILASALTTRLICQIQWWFENHPWSPSKSGILTRSDQALFQSRR